MYFYVSVTYLNCINFEKISLTIYYITEENSYANLKFFLLTIFNFHNQNNTLFYDSIYIGTITRRSELPNGAASLFPMGRRRMAVTFQGPRTLKPARVTNLTVVSEVLLSRLYDPEDVRSGLLFVV